MSNLISRSALKEALKEAHIRKVLTFDISTYTCVMNIIDNAPTIEEYKEPNFCPYCGADMRKGE